MLPLTAFSQTIHQYSYSLSHWSQSTPHSWTRRSSGRSPCQSRDLACQFYYPLINEEHWRVNSTANHYFRLLIAYLFNLIHPHLDIIKTSLVGHIKNNQNALLHRGVSNSLQNHSTYIQATKVSLGNSTVSLLTSSISDLYANELLHQ